MDDDTEHTRPPLYRCMLCAWSFHPISRFDEAYRIADHDAIVHGIPR